MPSLSCTLLSLQVFNSSFVLSVIKNGEVSGLGIVSENTAVLAAACWRQVYESGSQVRVCLSDLSPVWSVPLKPPVKMSWIFHCCHLPPNTFALGRRSLCWFDHGIMVSCSSKWASNILWNSVLVSFWDVRVEIDPALMFKANFIYWTQLIL